MTRCFPLTSPRGAPMFFGTLLTACGAHAQPVIDPTVAPAIATSAADAIPLGLPVLRYGRYRLVEVGPTASQRDLMRQVIDVTLPVASDATVGDALGYVLQRSGYQLGQTPASAVLTSRPLPAAHDHLGPMTLRDALTVLAGPAWVLRVNPVARQVWFEPASPPAPAVPPSIATPVADAPVARVRP